MTAVEFAASLFPVLSGGVALFFAGYSLGRTSGPPRGRGCGCTTDHLPDGSVSRYRCERHRQAGNQRYAARTIEPPRPTSPPPPPPAPRWEK